MELSEFDYELPKELIAQEPASPRDSARLMVLNGEKIEHRFFRDVQEYFSEGDVLVLNNTKVIPARLIGKKETGGKVELLLLRQDGSSLECLIKGRVREGSSIFFQKGISAEVKELHGGRCMLECKESGLPDIVGVPPLPPYIKKELKDADQYQTVYAKEEGSLAAPTAGLHFTRELLENIQRKGVRIVYITLHIGPGTFLPVKGNDVSSHRMEEEYYKIDAKSAALLNEAIEQRSGLFITGTSTVRALESAFANGEIVPGEGWTSLFIYPGYRFRNNIHALITNFHLPKSTVLLLTAAYAGRKRLFKAYKEAVRCSYRFYSFGDAMLITEREEENVQNRMLG